MPFLEQSEVITHYQLQGSGLRLMVVTGTGSDLRHEPNPFSWPLAAGFEILAFDHRGLGQSQPTNPETQPTMADFAADALGLADAMGWDEFRLLGVSFGGMVAQEMALRAGTRIERLVLAGTSSGGQGQPSFGLHEVYAMDRDERLDRLTTLFDVRAADDPERAARIRAVIEPGAPETSPPGLVRQLEARRHHDTWDRLTQLNVPTLVAAGEFDGVAPLENARALAGQIPGAELAVFRGGHFFLWQDRTAWPAITAFLSPPFHVLADVALT